MKKLKFKQHFATIFKHLNKNIMVFSILGDLFCNLSKFFPQIFFANLYKCYSLF